MSADFIDTLPTDDSEHDKQLANVLFKEEDVSAFTNIAKEFKDGVIICFLFILFQSTQMDDLIYRLIPQTQSNYILFLGIKCITIVICPTT